MKSVSQIVEEQVHRWQIQHKATPEKKGACPGRHAFQGTRQRRADSRTKHCSQTWF